MSAKRVHGGPVMELRQITCARGDAEFHPPPSNRKIRVLSFIWTRTFQKAETNDFRITHDALSLVVRNCLNCRMPPYRCRLNMIAKRFENG